MEKQMKKFTGKFWKRCWKMSVVMKNYDVLGHLDYVVRYGKDTGDRQYSYQKYAELIDEILQNSD